MPSRTPCARSVRDRHEECSDSARTACPRRSAGSHPTSATLRWAIRCRYKKASAVPRRRYRLQHGPRPQIARATWECRRKDGRSAPKSAHRGFAPCPSAQRGFGFLPLAHRGFGFDPSRAVFRLQMDIRRTRDAPTAEMRTQNARTEASGAGGSPARAKPDPADAPDRRLQQLELGRQTVREPPPAALTSYTAARRPYRIAKGRHPMQH